MSWAPRQCVRHQGVGCRMVKQGRRLCSVACPSLPPSVGRILDRTDWLLPDPAVQVTIVREEGGAVFSVIRDDLTHPFLGGNKFRKLDGLWGELSQATDIVTCGGLQSAHTVAVAAAAAAHGLRSHLLVRGERPALPTGHHLYARMFAHELVYVSRAEYANRQAMFDSYVEKLQQQAAQRQQQQQQQQQGQRQLSRLLPTVCSEEQQQQHAKHRADATSSGSFASSSGSSLRIAVVPEGAANPGALLGLVRLVSWLWQHSPLAGRCCNIVVDSGTGATATGVALGAALLGLPWQVTGITLAAPAAYYQEQQQSLTAAFCATHGMSDGAAAATVQQGVADRLRWVPRPAPRKFGRALPGEVERCRQIAQRHGICTDPIWSLAAWEVACQLAQEAAAAGAADAGGGSSSSHGSGSSSSSGDIGGSRLAPQAGAGSAVAAPAVAAAADVVMLHTGGMLGLCGLAQRHPDQF